MADSNVSVRVSPSAPTAARALKAEDPMTVVIFGASGDLAKRKLLPALYHLHEAGFLPPRYAVIGFSRTPMTDEAYREQTLQVLTEKLGAGKITAQHPLLQSLHYQAGDGDKPEAFKALAAKMQAVEQEHDLPGNRLFYLSVAPSLFPIIIPHLAGAGLIHPPGGERWSRVIIEKPFGRDLKSARELTATIRQVLDESQIYRIDHYLGKETVQNILSFRFGNSIFEPLFNHHYVDSVQITVGETLGMEGNRGAYYDTAGVVRDMVQNHMLQLFCLIAMEPPSALDAQSVRDEKVKVLRALVPMTVQEVAQWTVRGQYGVGERNGEIVHGYRQEKGVQPDSTTESYVALRTKIDNWRWAGVPFLLRSGKRLAAQVSEIGVRFKRPPMQLFRDLALPTLRANWLILRIQPQEGMSLSFACKRPGIQMHLDEVTMEFLYGQAFKERTPEAYERLLLDALRGDASLFTRSDEVEYAWRFISSLHEGWAALPPPVFPNYYPFTDGPEEAGRLLEGLTARWRPIGPPKA